MIFNFTDLILITIISFYPKYSSHYNIKSNKFISYALDQGMLNLHKDSIDFEQFIIGDDLIKYDSEYFIKLPNNNEYLSESSGVIVEKTDNKMLDVSTWIWYLHLVRHVNFIINNYLEYLYIS